MTLASLKTGVRKLHEAIRSRSREAEQTIERLREDPSFAMFAAGLTPDPWQADLLRSAANQILLLCSRQARKSSVSAALAINVALTDPGSLVLLLSPSLRQSSELFRKALDLYLALKRPVAPVRESALQLELTNGSRIVSLPATEGTIRGYSRVKLLIIDEAARVADTLYFAIRPMLSVSRGRLVCLSTAFGQRGFFYDEWSGTSDWERIKVTADQVPRITPEFLAEERKAMGERWFAQEYLCSFEAVADAVFDYSDIQAALCDDVKPLFAA